MKQPLNRLLSRFKYGTLSADMFEQELREAVRRISDSGTDLLVRAATIRLWHDSLLRDFQTAFDQAGRAVNRLAMAEAVRHLRTCERAMDEMRRLLTAVDATDQAASSLEQLYELVSHARLRHLPALASIGQLVQTAHESILARRYTQAATIARYASSHANALLTSGDGDDDDNRIDVVEQLCDASETFAPSSEESPEDSADTLRALQHAGYGPLTTRLLTELEIDLAGRRRFMEWMSRNAVEADEARRVVADHSWDGAIDHYHHRALTHLAPVITAQLTRLSSVAEELQCNP